MLMHTQAKDTPPHRGEALSHGFAQRADFRLGSDRGHTSLLKAVTRL
jgi:hypothetical protein